MQVIILDPMYDAYAPMAARAGGVVVPVKLNLEDWSVPHKTLERAFGPRTKLILVNTPHNPTGKVSPITPAAPPRIPATRKSGNLWS
jgi:aspartate/methionine/tyrosine aminotransferase